MGLFLRDLEAAVTVTEDSLVLVSETDTNESFKSTVAELALSMQDFENITITGTLNINAVGGSIVLNTIPFSLQDSNFQVSHGPQLTLLVRENNSQVRGGLMVYSEGGTSLGLSLRKPDDSELFSVGATEGIDQGVLTLPMNSRVCVYSNATTILQDSATLILSFPEELCDNQNEWNGTTFTPRISGWYKWSVQMKLNPGSPYYRWSEFNWLWSIWAGPSTTAVSYLKYGSKAKCYCSIPAIGNQNSQVTSFASGLVKLPNYEGFDLVIRIREDGGVHDEMQIKTQYLLIEKVG